MIDEIEARDRLRDYLHIGDTVYTILRHVTATGTTRAISLVIVDGSANDGKGAIVDIDYFARIVLGRKMHPKYGGLVTNTYGMDAGFDLVYDLGRKLWPNGYGCVGRGCPSVDHRRDDGDHAPHTAEHSHWHEDYAYALGHRWL